MLSFDPGQKPSLRAQRSNPRSCNPHRGLLRRYAPRNDVAPFHRSNASGFGVGAFARTMPILFAPMMPHLAEECWAALGHASLIAESPWPAADRGLIVATHVTYVVQINGRKRAELTIERGADAKSVEAAALALDAVRRALDNKPPKKVIVVPRRIVNVVI